jgi:ATP-binding cassette subfamily B protein
MNCRRKIATSGININHSKRATLRRSAGHRPQETNLFTGTVRENIRYGRLDATDEEVEAAAMMANADDFIRRLPQGYDTVLTGNELQPCPRASGSSWPSPAAPLAGPSGP